MRVAAVVLVIWLLIGAFAAYQRGYFTGAEETSCAEVGTVLLTIVVGPLNYVGINPKVDCRVPQPSQ